MCASEEERNCIAYDIAPTRPDVIQNDARKIPLAVASVDMIFIDSPYGDNIYYNDHPGNLGKISAEADQFYEELTNDDRMPPCAQALQGARLANRGSMGEEKNSRP